MKRPNDTDLKMLRDIKNNLRREVQGVRMMGKQYRPSTQLKAFGFSGSPKQMYDHLTTNLIMWDKELSVENEIFQQEVEAKLLEDGSMAALEKEAHQSGLNGITEADFKELDEFGFPK